MAGMQASKATILASAPTIHPGTIPIETIHSEIARFIIMPDSITTLAVTDLNHITRITLTEISTEMTTGQ
jgi:hypothetical protein